MRRTRWMWAASLRPESTTSRSRRVERSVEARGKRPQHSSRITVDRLSVRDDDSPQIAALRPTPELLRDLALVLAQHELHRPRDMRIDACESHDPKQPAADAALPVDVANEIVDDDGQAVIAIDFERGVGRNFDIANRWIAKDRRVGADTHDFGDLLRAGARRHDGNVWISLRVARRVQPMPHAGHYQEGGPPESFELGHVRLSKRDGAEDGELAGLQSNCSH